MESLPKLLCVDDEVQVLESTKLNLRRHFTVFTAASGTAGLQLLHEHPDMAVITSDMRMPEMNGAVFLAKSRAITPHATRVLLTGQTDLDAAVAAVNEGQIFRFINKPCPPATLLSILQAALEQHRLVTAERVLLEQTLRGCVKTLCDVLAVTCPAAFGRAIRVRDRSALLAKRLNTADVWQVEVAAMLSYLGSIILPDEMLLKVNEGRTLTREEMALIPKAADATDQFLAPIPRLENVRAIIRASLGTDPPSNPPAPQHIIRLARRWDDLQVQAKEDGEIREALQKQGYEPGLLRAASEAFAAYDSQTGTNLPVSKLTAGMRLFEDLKLTNGVLLVARGFEVTPSFVARLANMNAAQLPETIRVFVPRTEGHAG